MVTGDAAEEKDDGVAPVQDVQFIWYYLCDENI